jgi:hypothetical protein
MPLKSMRLLCMLTLNLMEAQLQLPFKYACTFLDTSATEISKLCSLSVSGSNLEPCVLSSSQFSFESLPLFFRIAAVKIPLLSLPSIPALPQVLLSPSCQVTWGSCCAGFVPCDTCGWRSDTLSFGWQKSTELPDMRGNASCVYRNVICLSIPRIQGLR